MIGTSTSRLSYREKRDRTEIENPEGEDAATAEQLEHQPQEVQEAVSPQKTRKSNRQRKRPRLRQGERQMVRPSS